VKLMPAAVAMRVYREHQAFYDKLQLDVAKAAGAQVVDPDTALANVAASGRLQAIVKKFNPAVVLVSGCQDNQTSLDGEHNGAFTEQLLAGLLAGVRGQIKGVLTDQSVIAGVGNAYSDEVLWEMRMSPFKPTSSLRPDDVQRLHDVLVGTLRAAVGRAEGLAAKALKAEKKSGLSVHGRAGQPCPRCGDTVREVSFSTKALQYCPTCQTGGKPLADRRLSRLLK